MNLFYLRFLKELKKQKFIDFLSFNGDFITIGFKHNNKNLAHESFCLFKPLTEIKNINNTCFRKKSFVLKNDFIQDIDIIIRFDHKNITFTEVISKDFNRKLIKKIRIFFFTCGYYNLKQSQVYEKFANKIFNLNK
jgi:hypothetical protein